MNCRYNLEAICFSESKSSRIRDDTTERWRRVTKENKQKEKGMMKKKMEKQLKKQYKYVGSVAKIEDKIPSTYFYA